MDTQWPRWKVFKQDAPDKLHQAVGSVHAPDAVTALQMARDVFVRRPKAYSLWVAPADAIGTWTREELESRPPQPIHGTAADSTFVVFRKQNQRRSMTFVDYAGRVSGSNAEDALARAIATMADSEETWVWWIVPAEAIVTSDEQDVESWFDPAVTKRYRHQSAYGFVGPRRSSRTSGQGDN